MKEGPRKGMTLRISLLMQSFSHSRSNKEIQFSPNFIKQNLPYRIPNGQALAQFYNGVERVGSLWEGIRPRLKF